MKGPAPPGSPDESGYPSPSRLSSVPACCCLSGRNTCMNTGTRARRYALVSNVNVNSVAVTKAVSQGRRSQRCRPVRLKNRRRWQQGFTTWQLDLLICLYLSRNWRTKSSNSAEAKHRSFSIWEAQTETMEVTDIMILYWAGFSSNR